MGLSVENRSVRGRGTSEVELDLGRYELRRAGRRVKLEKKSMELLIFLACQREQMVSREDIIARLWPSNLFIDTERNINNIVRKIRRALGDNAAKPRFLETVVGKGYRFIGPMRVISPRDRSSHEVGILPSMRPSLAVLPLRLHGDVQDENGLSLGYADALVTRLANLEGVDVFPTSAILNVPTHETVKEIAWRLSARFVVHGAIQVSTGGSRLSVELFDFQYRSYFKKRLALDLDRPFEAVDDIATQIAKALNRPLHQTGLQSHVRYSRDPLAYAEFLQGYKRSSSGDPKLLEEATQHLMNAVARDPSFALAHANLSFVCAARHLNSIPVGNGWTRPNFIASALWNSTRICPKRMSPRHFCSGDRQETFSISKL